MQTMTPTQQVSLFCLQIPFHLKNLHPIEHLLDGTSFPSARHQDQLRCIRWCSSTWALVGSCLGLDKQLPWEPKTFIFRGYFTHILGCKTFIVHGLLGSKELVLLLEIFLVPVEVGTWNPTIYQGFIHPRWFEIAEFFCKNHQCWSLLSHGNTGNLR